MNRIRTTIIDDEPVARKGIEQYVSKIKFLQLNGSFSNPLKAPNGFIEQETDLLLLDIKMQGINGLEYYQSLAGKGPLAIVISAFPEFALDGFDLAITDYLVKPVSFERFHKAVTRAKEFFELKQTPRAGYDTTGGFFFIKTKGKIQRIITTDILYIEGLANYVIIHTFSGNHITYLGLGELAEKLVTDNFIRSHKSYLVAVAKVENISGNEIKVGNDHLPLSKFYKDEFMKRIEPHLLRKGL